MNEVRNLDEKRVCDISHDHKVVEIVKKDCITRIHAEPDGTLAITHEKLKPAV